MRIKVISTSTLRGSLADSLDAIGRDDILIVTRRSKKERAIIDLDKLEDLLAASNPAYLEKIAESRRSDDYFSHEDAFGDI